MRTSDATDARPPRRRHAPRPTTPHVVDDAPRARLEELRDALRARVGGLAQVDDDSARPHHSNHLAEDAQELEQREGDAVVRRFLQRDLAQVEHALTRLAHGQYGLCEVCGRQIAPRRLEVLPAATLCVECQAHKEAGRAPH
jgi:RNA polymerase-binding transcription factor